MMTVIISIEEFGPILAQTPYATWLFPDGVRSFTDSAFLCYPPLGHYPLLGEEELVDAISRCIYQTTEYAILDIKDQIMQELLYEYAAGYEFSLIVYQFIEAFKAKMLTLFGTFNQIRLCLSDRHDSFEKNMTVINVEF